MAAVAAREPPNSSSSGGKNTGKVFEKPETKSMRAKASHSRALTRLLRSLLDQGLLVLDFLSEDARVLDEQLSAVRVRGAARVRLKSGPHPADGQAGGTRGSPSWRRTSLMTSSTRVWSPGYSMPNSWARRLQSTR